MEPPTTIPPNPAFEVLGKLADRVIQDCRDAIIKISVLLNPNRPTRENEMQAIEEMEAFSWAIRSQRSGATNFPISAGNMIPIMFRRGEALPLRWRRILRARMSRGEGAECPHNRCGTWPQTRQIHDLNPVQNRTSTQSVHVHLLSAFTFSACPRPRPPTNPARAQAMTSIIREPVATEKADCPQTVRRRGLSTTTNSSRAQSVRELGPVISCPLHHLTVSIGPPRSFSIHIQIIPSHELV